MVSLGDESRQGGSFFNGEANMASADTVDLLMDNRAVSANFEPHFRSMAHTAWAIVLELLIMVCLELAVFLVPAVCGTGQRCEVSAYAILVYTHASLWFLLLLFDRYYRRQHALSRNNGYLEFYRKTRRIRRAPLVVLSGGNALLAVLVMVKADYCKSASECGGSFLAPIHHLQILISCETLVVLPALLVYLMWTVKFRSSRAPPDVHEDDMLLSYGQSHIHTSTEIGFRDETYQDEILEKQADLIRYLKEHNNNLSKTILKLTARLNSLEGLS